MVNNVDSNYQSSSSGSVELSDNRIIYDDNFKPSINSKIINNTNFTIVAVELVVRIPNENSSGLICLNLPIKKKLRILPHSTGLFSSKFVFPRSECNIDKAYVWYGDFIFENGYKINLQSPLDRIGLNKTLESSK